MPDILQGDGIYSRYFTEFGSLTADSQLFTVRVEVGGSRARVVTGREDPVQPRAIPVNGEAACCGSTIGNVTTVPVFDLSRTASGGGVLVSGVADPQRDVYPPSRVTDLMAETNAEEQTIAFSWSAPGDDFDKPDTAGEKSGPSGCRALINADVAGGSQWQLAVSQNMNFCQGPNRTASMCQGSVTILFTFQDIHISNQTCPWIPKSEL